MDWLTTGLPLTVGFLILGLALFTFVFWVLPRWLLRLEDKINLSHKQTVAILGGALMLCGFSLFGMVMAPIHSWWQEVLLVIGSCCTVAKGWRLVVEGLDLQTSGSTDPDKRGPPL